MCLTDEKNFEIVTMDLFYLSIQKSFEIYIKITKTSVINDLNLS